MRASKISAGIAGMLLLACQAVQAGILGQHRVASGLASPMFVTHAPNDPSRLFIGERGSPGGSNATANIRILDLNSGTLSPTPFLSITGVNTSSEGGLLGMAFHPDYATNGLFYVYLTANDNVTGTPFSSYIRQYETTANPNVADPDFTPVLEFTQPQANHNGGWIGFSPNDDYLYIMSGDGGGGGDTGTGHTAVIGNAQDLEDNLLGKVLRIDVDADTCPECVGNDNLNYAIPPTNPFVGLTNDPDSNKDDEIWAYGLRNPFRASFDRQTGDLWIGDVGQGAREEIDFQPGDSAGGENYGWRPYEGKEPFGADPEDPLPEDFAWPVYDYPRTGAFGGKTVIGGYVYRGPDPELEGQYFFADSGDFDDGIGGASNKFWTFDSNDISLDPDDPEPAVTDIRSMLEITNGGDPRYPVSYGEDADGNLYIVYLETNDVYRIATGDPLPGDYNFNGIVDAADYTVWRDAMTAGSTSLINRGPNTGAVDQDDFLFWRAHFGESLGAGAGTVGVPEPGGVLLALQMLCCLALGAWYNRS